MGSKISILPTLEKHRIDKSGKAPIVIIIYLNVKHVARCTHVTHKIEPHQWDSNARRVNEKHANFKYINANINKRY